MDRAVDVNDDESSDIKFRIINVTFSSNLIANMNKISFKYRLVMLNKQIIVRRLLSNPHLPEVTDPAKDYIN